MLFYEVFLAALAGALPAMATARTMERDVVVIGGGAAGSHAAVRLRDDFGKSIVLVEKEGILVGEAHWTHTLRPVID